MAACRQRGWLSVFTHDWEKGFGNGPAPWASHPKGYFQPGVLTLSQAGRVLYRWRSRPSRKNIGGAIARPTASHVWERVQAALDQPANTPDAPHDDAPELDSPTIFWPFFVALLLANGWFLKPAVFGYRGEDDPIERRLKNAAHRCVGFIALWVVAFVFLPVGFVGLALGAWGLKVLPGIRQLNRNFQNVAPEEGSP